MNLLKTSLLAIALTASAPLFAQESTTATDQQTQADEAFPVDGGTGEGPYVRETHGAWEVRCIKTKDGEGCNLYQLLKDEQGASVAELNLEVLPEGSQAAAGVTLVTPLGTLLTEQITMQIDSGAARRYPFSWCEAAGCVSRFGLTNDDIANMQKGAAGKISLVSIVNPKEPVILTLALSGFTAAWKSIPPLKP